MGLKQIRNNIVYYLKWFYMGFFIVRNLVCLLLNAYYTTLSTRRHQVEFAERRQLVYTWLTYFGSNFRALTAGGVFAHAYQLYLALAQTGIHFWLLRKYIHLDSNGFYVFMTDEEKSQKMTAERLEEYIKDTANSNLNYSRNLAQLQARDMMIKEKSNKITFNGMREIRLQYRYHLAQLRRQHQHLDALLVSNKETLRPWATRNPEWRQRLYRICFAYYLGYTLFIWLCWTSAIVVAHLFAHQNLLKAQLPSTWLDHFARTEQLLFAFAIIEWFAYQLGLVISNVYDQLGSLRQLNLEFNGLLAQITVYIERGKANDDDQFDLQALELYIRYRFFAGQLQPCLELVSFYISHYVGLILPLAITVASVTGYMSAKEAMVSFWATIMVMCTVHLIMSAGAFLNAKCMRLTKRIWSLQALGVGGLYRHQLVSPHTLLLWYRISYDQQQMMNSCSCKLFNSIRIDYTSLIRLDIWIVSFVILVLTNR